MVPILADIANRSRVRRSERALAAVAKLRRQGHTEHLGRPKLVVDRDAVRRMAADGMSLRAIAEEAGISPATAMRIVKALP